MQDNRNIFFSSQFSLATLLIANIVTLWFFIYGDYSIMQVLWTYWLQSVIIGVVNIFRIYSSPLRAGSTFTGFPGFIKNSDVDISTGGKFFLSLFFTFHYGSFHFVYMLFLIAFSMPGFSISSGGTSQALNMGAVSWDTILLSGAAFAAHHYISFLAERRYLRNNPEIKVNTDSIFKRPYARIVPMHLIIIFGPMVAIAAGTNAVFILFMVIKTIADWKLYKNGVSHPTPVPTVVQPNFKTG